MMDNDPGLPKWTIFGWTDIVGNPGYFKDKENGADEEAGEEGFPMTLPDGVPSRVRFVAADGCSV